MTKSEAKNEPTLVEGDIYENVMLETTRGEDVSRPRVKPASHCPAALHVWFPRDLRTAFPIGTRFRATVKVSQKHWAHSGEPKGEPYLSASNIGVIVASIPDVGMHAKLKPGSKSGRAYYYIWEK
ncbi:MAG: hypothetical protein IT486_08065 [Gammaproteobacteria bacterium]|nr:hypothetical protein [Gammaproteobacteria bacterium]